MLYFDEVQLNCPVLNLNVFSGYLLRFGKKRLDEDTLERRPDIQLTVSFNSHYQYMEAKNIIAWLPSSIVFSICYSLILAEEFQKQSLKELGLHKYLLFHVIYDIDTSEKQSSIYLSGTVLLMQGALLTRNSLYSKGLFGSCKSTNHPSGLCIGMYSLKGALRKAHSIIPPGQGSWMKWLEIFCTRS